MAHYAFLPSRICQFDSDYSLIFVLWCNGSTTVFGAVCLGSNPRGTTNGEMPERPKGHVC